MMRSLDRRSMLLGATAAAAFGPRLARAQWNSNVRYNMLSPAQKSISKILRVAAQQKLTNPITTGLNPNAASFSIATSTSIQSPATAMNNDGVNGGYNFVVNGSPNNLIQVPSVWTWEAGYAYVNTGLGWALGVSDTIDSSGTGGNVDNTGRQALTWRSSAMTDAQYVSMQILGNSAPYRLLIDDQYVIAGSNGSPGGIYTAPAGGGGQWLNINFGSRAPLGRKITIEGYTGGGGLFQVWVNKLDLMWPIDLADHCRMGVVGDSIGDGTGATWGPDGWTWGMGYFLGIHDTWGLGVGSTGYIAGSTAPTPNNYINRIANWTIDQPNWDLLVFSGGNNDAGNTQAAVTAAALAVLSATRKALPQVPIVVLGCDGSAYGPSAAEITVELGIIAAVNTLNDPLMQMCPLLIPSVGGTYNGGDAESFGTGNVASPNGSGNSDLYISSDNTHPITIGHQLRARHRAGLVHQAVANMWTS